MAIAHLHQQFVLVLRAKLFSRELRWKGFGKVAFNVVVPGSPFEEIDVWSGDYVIGITLCVVFFLIELSGGKFFYYPANHDLNFAGDLHRKELR